MGNPFPLYPFTDQQKVDIRRFCGFPPYGEGTVVFPYPWIMRQYLALEYYLSQACTQDEGNTIVTVYLAQLYVLQPAIGFAGANLDTDKAGPWTHNKNEVRDRIRLYTFWRLQLCQMIGIEPGPYLRASSGNIEMVV